ncbi:MAG: hypothetical protein KDD65_10070 [Bacteroidetes bacterium]|nr:hypothetical protein [Bacteroidota bacterium]
MAFCSIEIPGVSRGGRTRYADSRPTIRFAAIVASAVVCLWSAPRVNAQAPGESIASGMELFLTNSGFGIGGYVRDSVNTRYALTGELRFGSIKDERESAFFNRLGERSIPGKANYFLVLPIRAGLQRRVFAEQIEDNFRPFVQATAGPVVGWLYPYFDDCNGNAILEPNADCDGDGSFEEGEGERRLGRGTAISRGSARLGLGGSIGVGAYIRYGSQGARGFRITYSFDYFPSAIRLLEADVRGPQRFFGTPSITVFFGHLF